MAQGDTVFGILFRNLGEENQVVLSDLTVALIGFFGHLGGKPSG
jgi:hypothetical protein